MWPQVSHEDAQSSAEMQTANADFLAWLRAADVPVLPHRLSFYDALPVQARTKRTHKNPNLNVGAFGRLDIGILVDVMRHELLRRGLDGERVLYTDTDVLFAQDIDYAHLAALPLPTFAACTEVFSSALNSGVMLINATAWAAHYDGLVAYGVRKRFRFLSYDQTWVHGYFSHVAARDGRAEGWASLSDAMYNARGYAHPRRQRQVVLPRVWHWHGFKPGDVECWHAAIGAGRWPLRAWRNTVPGCTPRTRPRCQFMPVHGSGCRYFGRLKEVLGSTPCYLRTYTYLLQQHRRMLQIASQLVDVAASQQDGTVRRGSACAASSAARLARWERERKQIASRAQERASELHQRARDEYEEHARMAPVTVASAVGAKT